MNNNIISGDTRIGTLNGTLLVLLYTTIDNIEILKTCILAATGAAVSFLVSLLCKWIWNKMQHNNKDQDV